MLSARHRSSTHQSAEDQTRQTEDPEVAASIYLRAWAQVIRACNSSAEGTGAVGLDQTCQRRNASAAVGHANGVGIPSAAGQCAHAGEAGASDAGAKAAATKHRGAVDPVDLATGNIKVLAGCPAVGGIAPAEGLIGRTLQRDATTIGCVVCRAGNIPKNDVLVIHRQRGAVDGGRRAVDRQITGNGQVVAEGGVAAQRGTAEVDGASKRLIAADRLSGVQRDERTGAADLDDAGSTTTSTTSASSVMQNRIAFRKSQLRIGQARGCAAARRAFDADGVRHG